MRNLVYFVATTVDGYITTAKDVDPDFLLYDGPQAADLLREFPETIPGHLRSLLGVPNDTPNQRFDTVLMGRATYDLVVQPGLPALTPICIRSLCRLRLAPHPTERSRLSHPMSPASFGRSRRAMAKTSGFVAVVTSRQRLSTRSMSSSSRSARLCWEVGSLSSVR